MFCTEGIQNFETLVLMQVFIAIYLGILFLQSGFDKIIDWKGNRNWLTGHFEKSVLRHQVPVMLFILTVLEVLAGLCCAGGVVAVILSGCSYWIFLGFVLSASALLCLFFGQRMAKDYAGASSLSNYFMIVLIGLYLFTIS